MEARLYRLFAKYKRAFDIAGWVCLALISADYARVIDLPTIIAVPVWLSGIVSGARYAIWWGVLKPRFARVSGLPDTGE